MSTANLGGRLPDGDANGLVAIAGDLIDEPKAMRHAIILIDTVKITSKVDERSRIATARIRHIEPITEPGDMVAVDQLLRRAMRRRTGSEALPGHLDQAELPFTDEEE